jgi:hypothetical protein
LDRAPADAELSIARDWIAVWKPQEGHLPSLCCDDAAME